jgi:protein-S-isoprenylcysteine O-methyltransferase Ste14
MSDALRLCSLALFAVGPVVAVLALLRRGFRSPPPQQRVGGWRWYVPPLLLPLEWALPPLLIALHIGEIDADLPAVRAAGLVVGVGGAVVLTWASLVLGRFMVHEAAVRDDHVLVTRGPYRFVRHPVYSGYLALLLGAAVASLNVWLLLLWPVSLLGILVQSASEERLLRARFGAEYERYAHQTGLLLPLVGRQRQQARANQPGASSADGRVASAP